MGLQALRLTDHQHLANAEVNDFFLVKATKPIATGEEILLLRSQVTVVRDYDSIQDNATYSASGSPNPFVIDGSWLVSEYKKNLIDEKDGQYSTQLTAFQKEVDACVTIDRAMTAVNTNHKQKGKKFQFGHRFKWHYILTAKGTNRVIAPARWLTVKVTEAYSETGMSRLGVFAQQNFKKDDYIGLYPGKVIDTKSKKFSPYAKRTKFGIIDPIGLNDHINSERSVIDGPMSSLYGMGLHMVYETGNKHLVNAEMDDFFLVKATKPIGVGEEIMFLAGKNQVA
jgi:hypothetical protein